MKKLIFTLLLVTLLASCATDTGNTETAGTANTTKTDDEKVYQIGISLFTHQKSLTEAQDGFIAGLESRGYVNNDNIVIDIQNCQADASIASQIAQKFVADLKDLVLGIATPSAVSLARATDDAPEIPVLITAVTDPVASKLVESADAPGRNVTGTSDRNPVDEQIELMMDFLPELKKVSILFATTESNSLIQADEMKAKLDEAGIEVVYTTVSSPADISQVTASLEGKVDAIYIPTDNVLADGMTSVSGAVAIMDNKVPVFVAARDMVVNGALASVSVDYYAIGFATGEMAADILDGKSSPESMPIQYSPTMDIIVNQKIADEIGIIIPEKYLSSAEILK